MKQLSVRNVTPDLAAALAREAQLRGASLNSTALALLRRALGIAEQPFDNGLAGYGGTWGEEEYREFEAAVMSFEQVDEELWR